MILPSIREIGIRSEHQQEYAQSRPGKKFFLPLAKRIRGRLRGGPPYGACLLHRYHAARALCRLHNLRNQASGIPLQNRFLLRFAKAGFLHFEQG